MPTVELPAVAMWYGEHGQGDPCVLLHPGGAGVDSRALTPTAEPLSRSFHVYTPEQRAHGHTADVPGPITYELMAGDTIAFIETVIGGPVQLLGCSDGAVIALLVARRRPDLVQRLVFVAGVFHHDGWEDGVLDGDPPAFLRASYGEVSPDGVEHYEDVVAKLAAMHACAPELTVADLGGVTMRTLVMFGDDDEVRLEHAIAMYRGLANAELAIVPGTSHGLLVEKPELCNQIITAFLTRDAVQTFAPIRRARSTASCRSRYLSAMDWLSAAEIASLLEAAETEIRAEVTALPSRVTGWHPADGEWCVKECLGHLIEAERRGFAGRLRAMRAHGDGLALESWDQVAVARSRADCSAETKRLLDEFRAERARSLALVRSLQPSDLALGGEHPQVGHLTAYEVLMEWTHHDRNHFKQMLADVQSFAWRQMGNAQRFSLPH